MPRKRHCPESIAAVLRRIEASVPIAELARKAGVHENTIQLLKKKCGQLGAPEIREINELRDENTRLKRLVADLTLYKVIESSESKQHTPQLADTCAGAIGQEPRV